MTVYVIARRGDQSGLVKIGFTKSLKKRIDALLTATPEGFEVVMELDGGRGLEKAIHTALAGKKKAGEWFLLSPQDVKMISGMHGKEEAAIERHIPTKEDRHSPDIIKTVRYYLHELVKAEWRGMGDTQTGARDRVMDRLELPRSLGLSYWHKSKGKKDCPGELYRRLHLGYAVDRYNAGDIDDYEMSYIKSLIRSQLHFGVYEDSDWYGDKFIADMARREIEATQ